MQAIFLIFSTAAAVFVEFVFPWNIGGMNFPISAAIAIFWFWRISLSSRLALGIFLGVLFDSFHIFPPGTYLIAFLVEAFLVNFLKVSFSNAKLPVVQGISMGIMLMTFSMFVVAGSTAIGRITSEVEYWSGLGVGIAGGTLLWALILSAIYTAITHYSVK